MTLNQFILKNIKNDLDRVIYEYNTRCLNTPEFVLYPTCVFFMYMSVCGPCV